MPQTDPAVFKETLKTDIPMSLRSAADGVMLSAGHLRVLVGPDPVPSDAGIEAAVRRYGATSAAWQAWVVLRAVEWFTPLWQAYMAAAMPAQGERPSTTVQES